jgi:hypothetical protein
MNNEKFNFMQKNLQQWLNFLKRLNNGYPHYALRMVVNNYGKHFTYILYFKYPTFRIIELILSNQISHPFQLRICSDRSLIDEFDTSSNRYYHLEEVIPDESDQNKDSVLIPVAHYTKVILFSKI